MWERSPTARLIWGIALTALLLGFGPAALATGSLVWIGAFLLVLAIASVQLLGAGPAQGRLWDSPLTKVIYAYVALSGIYLFGDAAIETGSALAIVPLVLLVAVIAIQWGSVLADRLSPRS